MDMGVMSMNMHQASIQSLVSMSVLKIAMRSEGVAATEVTDMMSNMAVDTNKGTNIDAKV